MASVLAESTDFGSVVQCETRLSALVVDDDQGARLVLRALLQRVGFDVIEASDGESALAIFGARRPALVFLDVVMPGMDGYQVARALRARTGDDHVGIIFLTALTDPDELSQCLDAGGDDVVSKPYSLGLLRARIRAVMRARESQRMLRRQLAELNDFRRSTEEDIRVAQWILAKVARAENLAADNLRYRLRPFGTVSGDFILACRRPNGAQLLLLGDATGHGLPAAVTAMLISDTFYSMGGKGLAIPEIVLEMNKKLRNMLPVGRYLAAGIVEFDADERRVALWNAGLPDILVVQNDATVTRFASQHLPLGVVDNDQVEVKLELLPVTTVTRVVMHSDGVTEARDGQDAMFGSTRLEACVAEAARRGSSVYDRILRALDAFVDGAPRADDECLIELTCRPARRQDRKASTAAAHVKDGEWALSFVLQASALRQSDPVAVMVQAVAELRGSGSGRQRLFLVLTELYSNALEHGLLRLDSALKHEPDGFARYYEARTRAIDTLRDGTIQIDVRQVTDSTGISLHLRLAHNGVGFDASTRLTDMATNAGSSGRGIALVRSLSQTMNFTADGRHVDVVCRW